MRPDELLKQCDDQVAACGPETVVVLVLPGTWGKANTKRLLGRRGPVGQIVADACRPDRSAVLVQFKAREVAEFIRREFPACSAPTATAR